MLDKAKQFYDSLSLKGKIVVGVITVFTAGFWTLGIEGINSMIQYAPLNKELEARCEENFMIVTGEVAYFSLPDPNPNYLNTSGSYAKIGVNEGAIIKSLIFGEDREFSTGVYLPLEKYLEISEKANLPSRPVGQISIEGICEQYRPESNLVLRPLKVQFHDYSTVCEIEKGEVECTGPY